VIIIFGFGADLPIAINLNLSRAGCR